MLFNKVHRFLSVVIFFFLRASADREGEVAIAYMLTKHTQFCK